MEGAATPPRLALEASLADAIISGPLLDLPLDLGAGRVDGNRAAGARTATAWRRSWRPWPARRRVVVRDGVLVGFDLAALQAAGGITDLRAAEAALRQALAGGATAFERLEGTARLEGGRRCWTGCG